MSVVFECFGVADRSHHCRGGHHSDAWDGCDLLAQRGLFHDGFKPSLCLVNLRFDSAEPIQRHAQQRLTATGQLALCLLKDFGDGLLERCWRSVHGDASFSEQSSNLIDECGALMYQQFARSVDGLDVLLLDRLHRHEVHARPTGGLDDRLGIVAIVLVRFDEGFDIVRADQFDLDADGLELPCPMVRRTAGLHRDDSWTKLPNGFQQLRPSDFGSMQHMAATIGTVQLEHALGQVDAQNVNFHDEPPVAASCEDAQSPAKVASGPSQ